MAAKKNDNNFKNLDLQTIVDDPFADEVKKEPVRKAPKKASVKKTDTEKVVNKDSVADRSSTKKNESQENSAEQEKATLTSNKKKAKTNSKKADDMSFEELTDYVNLLPPELFRSKLSTVQIPQEFVELIKQISYETGKPAFQIATSIIQMGLSRMKGDIKDMIDRKSKRKIDLI